MIGDNVYRARAGYPEEAYKYEFQGMVYEDPVDMKDNSDIVRERILDFANSTSRFFFINPAVEFWSASRRSRKVRRLLLTLSLIPGRYWRQRGQERWRPVGRECCCI